MSNSSDSPVFDLHCDAVLKLVHRNARFANDNEVSHCDIPKMKKGNVNGLFYSLWSDPIFTGEEAVKRTQYMLDRCLQEMDECKEDLYFSKSSEDLDTSINSGKITAMLGIEGGHSINNSLQNLENFFNQGVRRMTLTHTKSVDWAGSATDEGKTKGLNEFGKEVVQTMNNLGMLIDVAHTSEKTTLDVAKVSKKPIFCTHSHCKSIFNTDRLASDEMINAIASTGGVFGIALFPAYFPNQNQEITSAWINDVVKKLNQGGQGETKEEKAHNNAAVFMDNPPPAEVASIEGLLPHLDHLINLIGEDHVGIGTDFDGMPFAPVGLENASKFDNLRSTLLNHGYSQERITKILGANARRVLKEILPTS